MDAIVGVGGEVTAPWPNYGVDEIQRCAEVEVGSTVYFSGGVLVRISIDFMGLS